MKIKIVECSGPLRQRRIVKVGEAAEYAIQARVWQIIPTPWGFFGLKPDQVQTWAYLDILGRVLPGAACPTRVRIYGSITAARMAQREFDNEKTTPSLDNPVPVDIPDTIL